MSDLIESTLGELRQLKNTYPIKNPRYVFVDGVANNNTMRRIFKLTRRSKDKQYALSTIEGEPNSTRFEINGRYVKDKLISIEHMEELVESQVICFADKLFTAHSATWLKKQLIPGYGYGEDPSNGGNEVRAMWDNMHCDPNTVTMSRAMWHQKHSSTKIFNPEFTQELTTNAEEKTMLDKVMNYNKEAVKSASTLAATKAVTQVVTDKLAAVVPAEVGAFLQTPLGAVVVANIAQVAVEVAADSMEYKTAGAARSVTKAMGTNAMSDVIAQFDLPGLVQSVLAIPEVSNAINDFE
jgi:hypothetical protein